MRLDEYSQNILFSSKKFEKEKKYWTDKLQGHNETSGFPLDFNRANLEDYITKVYKKIIPRNVSNKILQICNQSDMGLYILFLSAVKFLVAKYSGREDSIIGMPVLNRKSDIVYINNMVPLINKVEGNKTFKEFIVELNQVIEEAEDNKNFPLSKLINEIMFESASVKLPLIKTIVFIETLHEQFFLKEIKPDMFLSLSKENESLQLNLGYNFGLYDEKTVEKLAEHIINYFDKVTSNTNIKLSEIDVLSEYEKKRILYEFNDTATEYPRYKTINQIFEEQVKLNGNEIAVVFENVCLTYSELNERANNIAFQLIKSGVEPGDVVGIMVERSLDMMSGIIGILKAGAAYMPIDPSYPQERINHMINDSNTKIIISNKELDCNYKFEIEIINFDENDLIDKNLESMHNLNNYNDVAYVMYTSGSTGNPKGVVIEHKNVIRLVKNTNYIKFEKGDKILQTGELVFDASTFEIWGALLNGLQLYLIDKKSLLECEKLEEKINKYNISTMWLTAPLFNQLSEQNPRIFSNLKYLLVGGDVLSTKHINMVRNSCQNLRIINGYGPTENTTFSTCFEIKEFFEKRIPIGKPISNSTAFILDIFGQLQPIGVEGELFVGGDGVARQYLNSYELTQNRFVQDITNPLKRMYKTGDNAKWLSDGNIEFLGRKDFQVKIRGYRIELNEIEARMLENENINNCIVMVVESKNGEKELYAYFTAKEEIHVSELKALLAEKLPKFMIPSQFIQIEKMPMTTNGKIDRKAILHMKNKVKSERVHTIPLGRTEEVLVEMCKEIFKINEIGTDDNFFEIGGHSLSVAILTKMIQKKFDVGITLSDVFGNATIKEIAAIIESSEKTILKNIESVMKRDYYPVSSAQKRLLLAEYVNGPSISYNIPLVMIIKGKVDVDKIEEIFRKLVERHESLRTSFAFKEGEPVQIIHENQGFKINYSENYITDVDTLIEELIQPFDISKASSFRVSLTKTSKEEYLFIIDIHHIVSDGISVSLILKEFIDLFKGKELMPLKIQYKDFTIWQNDFLRSDYIKKQEEFWRRTFSGQLPVLDIPIDYSLEKKISNKGNTISQKIDKTLSAQVGEICLKQGTTLFMFLLAIYNITLSKFCAQTDIIVGSGVDGRVHADVRNVIGMFVNMIGIRSYPEPHKKFIDFLSEVKTNSINAFDNNDYPFDQLVNSLDFERQNGRNPLFDAVFEVQNIDIPKVDFENIEISNYNYDYKIAKFALTLVAESINEEINLHLQYKTDLFKKETVERILEGYVSILKQVLLDQNLTLKEYKIENKFKLLQDNNFETIEFVF